MKRVMGDEEKRACTTLRTIGLGSTFTRHDTGGKSIYLRGQSCPIGESDFYYITRLSTGVVGRESGGMFVEPCEFVFMEEKLVKQFGILQTRVQQEQ